MNGILTNIDTCNFRLCSYSINYYTYRKLCDVHILALAIYPIINIIMYFKYNFHNTTCYILHVLKSMFVVICPINMLVCFVSCVLLIFWYFCNKISMQYYFFLCKCCTLSTHLFQWILLCQYALLLYIILTVLLTLNFKKLFLVWIIPLVVLIHFPLDYLCLIYMQLYPFYSTL